MSVPIRDEIAARFPGAAERAKTSRATAVRLFCVECMGGSSREASRCTTTACFLWPHTYRTQRDVALAAEHAAAEARA